MQEQSKRVLAVYPFERGIAWAYMGKGEQTVPNMDKGIVYLDEGGAEKSLEGETMNLIWYFKPGVVAMRSGTGVGSKTIKEMITRLRLVFLSKDLPVERLEAKQVRYVLGELGAKDTLAARAMLCQELPELGLERLANWLGEQSRGYIFDAVSLLVAYKYLHD